MTSDLCGNRNEFKDEGNCQMNWGNLVNGIVWKNMNCL